MNKEDIFVFVVAVLGVIALIPLVAILFGWLTMLLWNALMPELFGLSTITFWQAVGLQLLSGLLLKSFSYSSKNK